MNINYQIIDDALMKALRSEVWRTPRSWTEDRCDHELLDLQERVIDLTRLDRISGLCDAVSLRNPVVFELPPNSTDEELRTVATALVLQFGLPCRVVQRWPLWHDIPVDPELPPHRFGGVGLNPLHMDMVNASRPPAAIGFLCFRDDPMGGGATLLTSTTEVLDQLTDEERELLRTHRLSEGQFFDYQGIGKPLKRFPVLDRELLRFTAKAETADIDPELQSLYEELTEIVEDTATAIKLTRGELLVFSNLHYLHGREALGDNQGSLLSGQRRCVNQVYLVQCGRCRGT